MWAGLVHSVGYEGKLVACLLPSTFWWFAGNLAVPWLIDASPQCRPSCSHDILPVSLSVSKFALL